MDIPLQTVKNSGPSERKSVQEQICKYIWETFSSFVANYPKESLDGLTFSDDLYFGYRTEIKNKIQNDSSKFSLIDAISDISVASEFTTHQ